MQQSRGLKGQFERNTEKSPQQLERERIYAEYDKAHPKPVVIDDPDDERFYMNSDEIREFERKKLAAESTGTFPDRMKAKREEIYAKTAPQPEPEEEPNPLDDRPALQKAVEGFLDKNPGIPESARKDICRTAEESYHPDVFALRKRAEQTGDARDYERWIARAAEVAPGEAEAASRRAATEKMARSRFPINL